jgi:signal transduction histidine kinase
VSPAWSFAQWPLKRKLFAALVFPVGLSFVLGGVAVQNDFEQAAQLANAADSTLQVRPVVEYNIAVQALAAAESVGGGGVISAITKYESAAADLRIALKSDTVSDKVKADAEDALALGNAVRAAKTQQSFSATVIDKSASTASVLSTMVGDLALSDDADSAKTVVGMQDTLASQRAMVGQQLNLGNAADSSAGMSALKQVGAEASFLTRLRGETGQANSADVRQLINENERRGLSLGGALDEATLTQLGEGYERSNAAYRSMLDRQLTELETTLRTRADELRQQAALNAALILTALLAALLIVIRLMRSLLNPIRAVRQGALDIARHKLPAAVARIRDGEEPELAQPIPVHTTEEMGQLDRAVDDLHSQALSLAGEQARLRVQVNSMFETLSRRSTSLVDQQLSLIERLERDEQDPKRLQSLFRLDHLAARMRRNSDSLLVLAGTSTRRGLSGSVSIADIVRAAVSEVENYQRIDIGDTSDDHVLGSVGSDLIHLLAELVDNALAYSPPTTRVSIRGARTSHGGLLVEVTDRGLGMPPDELAALNERLATGGEVTVDTARRMGLFVVGSLAQRHGVLVRLRRNAEERSGITVSVQLPAALLENRGGNATDAPAATAAGSAATAAAGTAPTAAPAPKPEQPTNGHAQPTRTAPANGRAAPASAPAASLEPLVIPGQSGPSADTTSSLPKRTPGQHGPVGSAPAAPAPAARSGLPQRTPGQHGPVESANAAADVAPAAAVPPASAPAAPGTTEPAAEGGLPQRTPGQHGPVESAGAAAPAGA